MQLITYFGLLPETGKGHAAGVEKGDLNKLDDLVLAFF